MARPSARKTSEESDEKVHLNDVPTKVCHKSLLRISSVSYCFSELLNILLVPFNLPESSTRK